MKLVAASVVNAAASVAVNAAVNAASVVTRSRLLPISQIGKKMNLNNDNIDIKLQAVQIIINS